MLANTPCERRQAFSFNFSRGEMPYEDPQTRLHADCAASPLDPLSIHGSPIWKDIADCAKNIAGTGIVAADRQATIELRPYEPPRQEAP